MITCLLKQDAAKQYKKPLHSPETAENKRSRLAPAPSKASPLR